MKKLLFMSSLFISGLLSAQTPLLSENFNAVTTSGVPATGPLPSGWSSTSGFKVYANHGTYNTNACSSEMNAGHSQDTLTMPSFTGVTATTKISIQYRFVNAALYPSTGTTLGTGDKVVIDAFVGASPFLAVATLDNTTNPAPLTTWTTYTYTNALFAFAGSSPVYLRLDVARANGDWFLDIDNIIVGDDITGVSYNALNPPSLLVFPNPSHGDFSVWLKNYQANNEVEVTIYNFIGQKVKTVTANGAVNNKVNVSTLGLEKGMYIVEVKSGSEVAKTKIQID